LVCATCATALRPSLCGCESRHAPSSFAHSAQDSRQRGEAGGSCVYLCAECAHCDREWGRADGGAAESGGACALVSFERTDFCLLAPSSPQHGLDACPSAAPYHAAARCAPSRAQADAPCCWCTALLPLPLGLRAPSPRARMSLVIRRPAGASAPQRRRPPGGRQRGVENSGRGGLRGRRRREGVASWRAAREPLPPGGVS